MRYARVMKNLWFITNPGSGSTTTAKCEALEAVFKERGLKLAGRTDFPEHDLPKGEELDKKKVDTVVLFAGDGTINAALCALADWEGSFLILPGGTMNLLAKALHDELDPAKIIHAAHDETTRVALPYVEAGEHRAFVGVIAGPAASWARAREAARKGKLGKLVGAVRNAWGNTFGSRGVRITGVRKLAHRYQAVLIFPDSDGLDVAGVDAREWRTIAQLGWEWLTGDWVQAHAVTKTHATQLGFKGTRRVLALFDGEPVTLDPGIRIKGGVSRKSFIATREEKPG